jgi:transaldolase
MEVIEEIRQIYDNYEFATQILAASIRSANHVRYAALAGADVATVPPAVLKSLLRHPLTDKGIEMFVADWKKTGQSIV